jgi:hypothetical protein
VNICKFALKRECLVQIPSTDVATFKKYIAFFVHPIFCPCLAFVGFGWNLEVAFVTFGCLRCP